MSARPNMTLAKWRDAHDRKCEEMHALDKRRTAVIESLQARLYELQGAARDVVRYCCDEDAGVDAPILALEGLRNVLDRKP